MQSSAIDALINRARRSTATPAPRRFAVPQSAAVIAYNRNRQMAASRIQSIARRRAAARAPPRPAYNIFNLPDAVAPIRVPACPVSTYRINIPSAATVRLARRLAVFNSISEGLGFEAPELQGSYYEDPWKGRRRRLPSNDRGFAVLFNRAMVQARKLDAPRRSRKPHMCRIETNPADWTGTTNHPGAPRYVVEKSQSQATPRPVPLNAGITFDISVFAYLSGSSTEETVTRKARVKVSSPRDLDSVLDLRFTPDELGRITSKVVNFFKGKVDGVYVSMFELAPTVITFTEVFEVTTGASLRGVMINDGPVTNCIIKPILSRFTERRDSTLEQMSELPAPYPRGKPKAGEVRDQSITQKRKRFTRELANLSTRIERLEEHNTRVMEMGGIKHGDMTTLRQKVADSGINSLTILTPLNRNKPYIHIDNPAPIGKVHGVDKTAVKLMLVSPSHIEAWGVGVSSTSSSFIPSAIPRRSQSSCKSLRCRQSTTRSSRIRASSCIPSVPLCARNR
jgi:hypothetical protein